MFYATWSGATQKAISPQYRWLTILWSGHPTDCVRDLFRFLFGRGKDWHLRLAEHVPPEKQDTIDLWS